MKQKDLEFTLEGLKNTFDKILKDYEKLKKENQHLQDFIVSQTEVLDRLKSRYEKAIAQNYCCMCGNTLDGYKPKKKQLRSDAVAEEIRRSVEINEWYDETY